MPTKKVSREDWLTAALNALARTGVSGVSVDPLAKELGVTRGSFYWHFQDRDALLAQALDLWEQAATVGFIAQLDTIADPRERLETLFREALLGDEIAGLEPAIVAHASHPVVRPVLERVTQRRLDYLQACYSALGTAPDESRRQAVAAYAAYLGWIELRRAAPDQVPEVAKAGPLTEPALAHLMRLLGPTG